MKDDWAGKRVVILGLARQGKALARFAAEAGAQVAVSDIRQATSLGLALSELADVPMETVFGDHPMSLLENTDVLAVSGGIPLDLPLVQEASDRGIEITNDSLEFMKRSPAPVVGVTGSAGKTTTTALTGALVKASGRRTWVGGNIGRPLIAELAHMRSDDIVAQELSSFQLELWNVSPNVATVLNLTPNHLDRHKTMAAYSAAKANILKHQKPGDVAVLSADDAGSMALAGNVRGRLRRFSLLSPVEDGAFARRGKIWLRDGGREMAICDLETNPLRGRHNILNVLAAVVLADSVGVAQEVMSEAIATFSGVEHRLELVRELKGVQYINDSIATAPERAIAAIDSFAEPLVLLAGGRDKDMVWDEWARRVKERVKAVVLFGDLASQLEVLLTAKNQEKPSHFEMRKTTSMADALALAVELAEPGDVVLLAPGGTSFDAFKDFEARGREFRRLVHLL